MKRLKLMLVALVAASLVVGALLVSTATASAARDPRAPWTLAQVAEACRATASAGKPGVVDIATALQDANSTTTIDVPCVIHLVGGAPVSLARVTLTTTKTLNVHDRGPAGAPSAISIGDSRITATGAGSGILMELNDPQDRIALATTTLDAPAGVVVHAAGMRNGDNSGGTVQMGRSVLRSTAADSQGVRVLAAETGGTVSLAETDIATPGDLTVLAARCNATLRGVVLDCSPATLQRQLGG